jgi:hypothetical protein
MASIIAIMASLMMLDAVAAGSAEETDMSNPINKRPLQTRFLIIAP